MGMGTPWDNGLAATILDPPFYPPLS
jgi:hypothetical protein